MENDNLKVKLVSFLVYSVISTLYNLPTLFSVHPSNLSVKVCSC